VDGGVVAERPRAVAFRDVRSALVATAVLMAVSPTLPSLHNGSRPPDGTGAGRQAEVHAWKDCRRSRETHQIREPRDQRINLLSLQIGEFCEPIWVEENILNMRRHDLEAGGRSMIG